MSGYNSSTEDSLHEKSESMSGDSSIKLRESKKVQLRDSKDEEKKFA